MRANRTPLSAGSDLLKKAAAKLADPEFLKFVLVGLANTGLTYLLYAALAIVLPYTLAYSITYVLGIVFSYLVNSLFVFKERLSFAKAFQFPLVYLVQYLVNVLLLKLLVELLGVHKLIAPVLIIAVTIPITFFLSRKIIKKV